MCPAYLWVYKYQQALAWNLTGTGLENILSSLIHKTGKAGLDITVSLTHMIVPVIDSLVVLHPASLLAIRQGDEFVN